jgi:hypothetical protein
MKSFSLITFLFFLLPAIIQAWAAPVDSQENTPAETIVSHVKLYSDYETAVRNWWDSVNQQQYNSNSLV